MIVEFLGLIVFFKDWASAKVFYSSSLPTMSQSMSGSGIHKIEALTTLWITLDLCIKHLDIEKLKEEIEIEVDQPRFPHEYPRSMQCTSITEITPMWSHIFSIAPSIWIMIYEIYFHMKLKNNLLYHFDWIFGKLPNARGHFWSKNFVPIIWRENN